jgi:hypothetical protein
MENVPSDFKPIILRMLTYHSERRATIHELIEMNIFQSISRCIKSSASQYCPFLTPQHTQRFKRTQSLKAGLQFGDFPKDLT